MCFLVPSVGMSFTLILDLSFIIFPASGGNGDRTSLLTERVKEK